VIGVDQGGNKYLLDGYCHRMKMSERWEAIKALRRKWQFGHPGVQDVKYGYEQYGMLDDINVFEDFMRAEGDRFEIVELATPETGGHSKQDRIERLEPEIRSGRFLLPGTIHHPEYGLSSWSIWTEEHMKEAEERDEKHDYKLDQIIYRPAKTDSPAVDHGPDGPEIPYRDGAAPTRRKRRHLRFDAHLPGGGRSPSFCAA
jgi:hypothetical protein